MNFSSVKYLNRGLFNFGFFDRILF